MEKCKALFFLWMIFTLLSCKKQSELEADGIFVQEVYIEAIKSDRVVINYKLSNLGYQETGVLYYKKSAPEKQTIINALRKDGVLKLSLLHLEPNTSYVFKVFFKRGDIQQVDSKEYTVKTLSSELAKFGLQINAESIHSDVAGNFTADLEGENLINLNLSELQIRINGTLVALDYPIQLTNGRYKIPIKGKVKPVPGLHSIVGYYQEKEILIQTVHFNFGGGRYSLSYIPTKLRGYFTSVFNNDLYYFMNEQVFKWNDPDQRLIPIGSIPLYTVAENVVGIQFDEQLFFPAVRKMNLGVDNDQTDDFEYQSVQSYMPASGQFYSYVLKDEDVWQPGRMIQTNHYFIHKGELYLTYSLVDQLTADPNVFPKTDRFVQHYNKTTKTFESKGKLNMEILNHNFISINDQLYLVGLVPVYDQGFRVSATLAVFKVSEKTFIPEEIYRAGTVAEPVTFSPKQVMAYEQKILMAAALDKFVIFDPLNLQLSMVDLSSGVTNSYLGSIFSYNNKLYLNADPFSTSQKIYEISIVKEH